MGYPFNVLQMLWSWPACPLWLGGLDWSHSFWPPFLIENLKETSLSTSLGYKSLHLIMLMTSGLLYIISLCQKRPVKGSEYFLLGSSLLVLLIFTDQLLGQGTLETLSCLLLKVNFQYSNARRWKQGYMAPMSQGVEPHDITYACVVVYFQSAMLSALLDSFTVAPLGLRLYTMLPAI